MKKPFCSTFLLFLLFRLSSILIVQTSYVPDEYWQSLEVAHYMAFGYGYLTWEWVQGLRSYMYPFMFFIPYKALQLFNLDFTFLIIVLPKILQAFLTALSDYYFFLLCNIFGFSDHWAKLVIFTNWFWYYCGSRTITNSFETSCTVIGLYYYPWNLFIKGVKGNKRSLDSVWSNIKKNSLKYLIVGAVNCIVRPTAVVIWAPLVLFQLFSLHSRYIIQFVLKCALPVVFITLPVSFLIDYLWYGKFIFPAYNFVAFNIFKGISSFYGTHPYHWYITQGLPVVLGFHYIPFIFGVVSILMEQFKGVKNTFTKIFGILMFVVVLNIIILSNIPHKEFRFALPLTPLMMLIVVMFSSDFFTPSRKTYKLVWTSLLIVSFLGATILLGITHQRGTLTLMEYFRSAISDCDPNCSFLFLMPCHSTPLYSHLHVNVSTRFLTCEPPITQSSYDESEDFFNNPQEWLNNYWVGLKHPSHVAFFDSIESSVKSFLENQGFRKKHEFLHTIFAENNSGRYIMVYEPN